MDGNRRDSGCRPFFCARCNQQLVRWEAGFHGQVTQMANLSGERRVPDFGNDSPYLFTPMYEASFKGTKR